MEGRTSRSNRHNRRLRASCDQCTDSKLKCDQVKPQCDRCASRGRACVYSLIRAVGRPPRSHSCASNPKRTSSSETDSAIRQGHVPDVSNRASQTGTIDIDNASAQESPEKRVQLQLPSPEETTGISETSSCQSTQETQTLEFSLDGDFDFNEAFEPLHGFPFDDISLDDTIDSFVPMDGFSSVELHRQPPEEKDMVTTNICCLNQLDTGAPTNNFVIASPEIQPAGLIHPAESPGQAVTERSTAKTKLQRPLFRVGRFSDIAPSKLHLLILQSCPDLQPSMRPPSTLKEIHNLDRCICPALIGSLQVFASNPALGAGPQGLITLDLLLLLDDQLWQSHHAISNCHSCRQLPSHFQKMTLCMMADWMTDNWKRWLQQRLIGPRSISYIRNGKESQQQPFPPEGSEWCCLRLGSTRIDDTTWRTCMQDLVKLRLIRLTRLIMSISYEGVYPESSRRKASSFKSGVDALKQETVSKIEMVVGMMDSCKT